ncbi:MAG: tRNA pseudouridine(38-40) synthase TruA [Pseudomonadota bacterium]
MRTLRMVLEYDGTAYHGWQRQANGLTIQQVLEEKIAVIAGETVKVIGSGRTDAGVHALGQVAHFKTTATIPDVHFWKGINSLIPKDIAVKALQEVNPSFHARYDAKSKVYLYQIVHGSVRPALLRQYAWFVPGPIDMERIREAAVYFMGTHDFSSFCSAHSDATDHVRTITDIRIETGSHGLIKIEIDADGFLRHMVRGIVGTLVDIGRGKHFVSDMQEILHAKDRRQGGMNAPPHGLFLKEVRY